jgi:malonate transporter
MDNLNVRNLIVLVMDFAIPCALFSTISSTSWPVLVEQAEPAVMMAVVFVALYAASYIWARKSLKMSISDASVLALTVGFPNSAAVAQTFRFDRKVAWATAAIVLIQPLFALCITELFHMSHADIRDITLISAIPGGFFGIVFGKSFNSTPETASSGLIASYCVGAFSMAGWMLVITKYL